MRDMQWHRIVMQDVGTTTIPDYVSIPCRCNPAPTDEEAADYTLGDFERDAARLGAELPGYGGPDWCPVHLREHCQCPSAKEDRAYCDVMAAPTDEEVAAWEDVHDLPVVDYDVPNPWIAIGF